MSRAYFIAPDVAVVSEKFTPLSLKQVARKIKQAQAKPNKAKPLLAEAKMSCDSHLQWVGLIQHHGEWLKVSLSLCTALYKQPDFEETQALATICSTFLEKNVEQLKPKDIETYRKQIQTMLDQCSRKLKPTATEIKRTSPISTPPETLKKEISTLLDAVEEKFPDNQTLRKKFATSEPERANLNEILFHKLLKDSRSQIIIWEEDSKKVNISPIVDCFILFLTVFNSSRDSLISDCVLKVITACQQILHYFKENNDNYRLSKIRIYTLNSQFQLSRVTPDEKALQLALADFLTLDFNLTQKDSIISTIEFSKSIICLATLDFHKMEQQKKMIDIVYRLAHKMLLTFKKLPPDAKSYASHKAMSDSFFVINNILGIRIPPENCKTLVDETREIVSLFLSTKTTTDTRILITPILQTLINLIKDRYFQLQSEAYQPIFSALVDIGLIFAQIPDPNPEETFILTALAGVKTHIGENPWKFSEVKIISTPPKTVFEKFLGLKSESLQMIETISNELKLSKTHEKNSLEEALVTKMCMASSSFENPLAPKKDPETIKIQTFPLVDFLLGAVNLYRSAPTLNGKTLSTITAILDLAEKIIALSTQYGFLLNQQGFCNYLRLHAYLLCLETPCNEEIHKLLANILPIRSQDLYFLCNEMDLIDSSISLFSEKFSSIKNHSLLAQIKQLNEKMIAIFTNLPLIIYSNIGQQRFFYALTIKNSLTVAGFYLNFAEEKENNSRISSAIINRIHQLTKPRKSISLTQVACFMVLDTIVKIFTNDFSRIERLETKAQQQLLEISQAFTPIGDPEERIRLSLEAIQLLQYTTIQPKQPVVAPEPDAKLQTASEVNTQEIEELKALLLQKNEALTEADKRLKRLQEEMDEKIKENQRIQKGVKTQTQTHQKNTEKLKSELKQASSEREEQGDRIKALEEELALQGQLLKTTQSERDEAKSALLESKDSNTSLEARFKLMQGCVFQERYKATVAIREQHQAMFALVDHLKQSNRECSTLKESLREAKIASKKLQSELTTKEEELDKTKEQTAAQQRTLDSIRAIGGWRPTFPYTPTVEEPTSPSRSTQLGAAR